MATLTSAPSVRVAATASSPNGWLTDPLDPTVALKIRRLGTSGSNQSSSSGSAGGAASLTHMGVPISLEVDSNETMGIFYGWGNPYPIVQRGTIQAPAFTWAALIEGTAEYQTWQSLTGRTPGAPDPRQRTLLLRDDMGNAYYVVIGPLIPDQLLRSPDRATNPIWVVTLNCTVVGIPAGNTVQGT